MKHYNPSITERANRIFNLKNGDGMSEEIEGPVAVIPIHPSAKIVRQNSGANNASLTIYTTPADKDFYLTAATLSYIKDATSTAASVALQVTIDGVALNVLFLPGITLTASYDNMALSFDVPIKLDRNTSIVCTASSAVANIRTAATIVGYLEEVTRT